MNNNLLIHELECLIENIQNNKYEDKYIIYLSTLIQKFTFVTQKNETVPSNKELINFLSLGWYIYNHIESS